MSYDAPAQDLDRRVNQLQAELRRLREEFEQYMRQHAMNHNVIANSALDRKAGF